MIVRVRSWIEHGCAVLNELRPAGEGACRISAGLTFGVSHGMKAPVPSYFLAPHVYPCVTDDHVVLLDLQRDKYLGLARDQMAALAGHVAGWPALSVTPPDARRVQEPDERPAHAGAEALINKMLAAGMLTTDPAVGKDASPVQVPRAESPLVEEDLEARPEVKFTDVVRFLAASALTALALKCRPIEAVVHRVKARKARGRESVAALDGAVAQRAVAAFIRLRPLLFGAQDACLFDSLALVRYLAWYKVYPTCVIGVQTKPFGAHCWVQEANIVFNDAPEYVRRFTPILTM